MSTHLATFCAISVNAFLRSHQVQGSVQTKKKPKKETNREKRRRHQCNWMGAGKTLPLEPRLIIISNPTKTDTLYDTKHRIMVTTTPSFPVFILKLLWFFYQICTVEPNITGESTQL